MPLSRRGDLTWTRTEFLRWPPVPKGKAGLPSKKKQYVPNYVHMILDKSHNYYTG